MIFLVAIIVVPTIIMCRLCDPAIILLLIPWGIITFACAGIEIIHAYRQAFTQDTSDPFHGGKIVRAIKFVVALVFYSSAIIGYIMMGQTRSRFMWIAGAICYGLVLVSTVMSIGTTPKDSNFRDNFDKIRWRDAIRKDILTSEVTEDDWHKDRSDEDWHGL